MAVSYHNVEVSCSSPLYMPKILLSCSNSNFSPEAGRLEMDNYGDSSKFIYSTKYVKLTTFSHSFFRSVFIWGPVDCNSFFSSVPALQDTHLVCIQDDLSQTLF